MIEDLLYKLARGNPSCGMSVLDKDDIEDLIYKLVRGNPSCGISSAP